MKHECVITVIRKVITSDGRRTVKVDVTRKNSGLVDRDELEHLDCALAIAVDITARSQSGQLIAHYKRGEL